MEQQPMQNNYSSISQSKVIAYLGIIGSKNDPTVLYNFNKDKKEELNFQINVFCGLDLMEAKILKKLNESKQGGSQVPCYVGLLNSVYLSEDEYDVYGFQTMTKTKYILILKQKSNMTRYDDQKIQNIFKEIQKIYQSDLFNPFNTYDLNNFKPSESFYKYLDIRINKFQEEFGGFSN